MRVRAILEAKGHAVVTAAPSATVTELVDVLARKSIGAVVIDDGEGGLAGIMTERDVVRALAAHGPSALDRPVADFMTRDVVTAGFEETVDEIMDRMTNGKFRHVPIMDGVRLAGMVSIGDVVKCRMELIEAEASAMRDYIATA
ncbi:CBS domain-containing protein [Hansschlegelia plantiphila]|uniref:Inosine-5-monophosphate dehydrogenase n=1 Tax=Hansschlegelia plantiphila TaxID=374655 RepID=A0A9W6IZB3_9HYPH|nr:CBS domain-containing protein [Hansschlegelia plantiphila]GLK67936.1 inosine-5-monophosphate dehydrogenase [Hansschlegelia plantiphila]